MRQDSEAPWQSPPTGHAHAPDRDDEGTREDARHDHVVGDQSGWTELNEPGPESPADDASAQEDSASSDWASDDSASDDSASGDSADDDRPASYSDPDVVHEPVVVDDATAQDDEPGTVYESTNSEDIPRLADHVDADHVDADHVDADHVDADHVDAERFDGPVVGTAVVDETAARDNETAADEDPPHDDGLAEQTDLKPGDVPAAPVAALWPAGSAQEYRDRWREAQLRFVDDPRRVADDARSLVNEAVDALTTALSNQRAELDRWQDENSDTERYRIVVQRYRDFLERLLAL